MKKIILICLFLLTGCTNQESGTTTEDVPATPTSPTVSVFSAQNSFIFIKNSSNLISTTSYPGENLKISIDAKNQLGSYMSGIASSIKVGIRYSSNLTDMSVVETAISGKYEASFSIPDQGYYEAYLKVNGVEQLTTNFSISYCNSNPSPQAAPFHAQIQKNSKNYWVICNSTQLASINSNSNYFNQNFILGNSIDLSNYYTYQSNSQIPDNQFKLTNSTGFSGEFEGNGFSIQNFKYISSNESNIGLFSQLNSGAKISNLSILSSQISGQSNVGGLAGLISATTSDISVQNMLISNINLSAQINNLGGLAGASINNNQSIFLTNISSNLTTTIPLTSTLSKFGSIIGNASGITASQISGFVNINYSGSNQISSIGGLFGELSNANLSNSGVIATLNLSNVSTMGCLSGKVSNSNLTQNYNGLNCQITVSSNLSSNVGGIIGYIKDSTIEGLSYFMNSNVNSSFGSFSALVEGSIISQVYGSGNLTLNQSSAGFVYTLTDSSLTSVRSSLNIVSNANQVSGLISNIGGMVSLSKVLNNNTISASNQSNISSLIGLSNNGSVSISNLEENSTINAQGLVSVIEQLSNSSLIFSNSLINPTLNAQDNTSALFGLINSSPTVSLSNLIVLSTQSLVSNGSIITTQAISSSITTNQIYWLSEKTQNYSLCGGGDSCSGISAIDVNTSANISQDLTYFSNSSNQPLSNWDFANIWVIGTVLPQLR